MANSKPTPSNNHSPDKTVGALLAWDQATGLYRIEHLAAIMQTPGPRNRFIRRTAEADARRFGSKATVLHGIEQAPGAGKDQALYVVRRVLAGYRARGWPPRGDKTKRAEAWLAAASDGFITVVEGPWTEEFFTEGEDFPDGDHDDFIDAVSIAWDLVHRSAPAKSKGAATAAERVATGSGGRRTGSTARRSGGGRAVRPTVRVQR